MRSGEKARTRARCPQGRAGRGRRPAVALRAACGRARGAGLRHGPCRGRSAPSVTACVSLQEPRASKCPLGFFGDNIINNASAEALTTVPSPRGQRALDSGARGAAGPHASLRPSEGAVQAPAPRPAGRLQGRLPRGQPGAAGSADLRGSRFRLAARLLPECSVFAVSLSCGQSHAWSLSHLCSRRLKCRR